MWLIDILVQIKKVSIKKYVVDSIGEGTIVRFIQTLHNYLKVSVRNDTYNFTEYDKIKVTDTTIIEHPNTDGYLLQIWVIECNDKNNNGKLQKFNKSTKTNSPTGYLGATSLPPIGDSFMYIEASSNNHGNNAFCSFDEHILYKIVIPLSIITDFQF